jgi:hypothetical protein
MERWVGRGDFIDDGLEAMSVRVWDEGGPYSTKIEGRFCVNRRGTKESNAKASKLLARLWVCLVLFSSQGAVLTSLRCAHMASQDHVC